MIIPIDWKEEFKLFVAPDGGSMWIYPRRLHLQVQNWLSHIRGDNVWIDVPRSMRMSPLNQLQSQ